MTDRVSVQLVLRGLPAADVLAWLEDSDRILVWVRSQTDFDDLLPPDVATRMAEMLLSFRAGVAGSAHFEWSGAFQADELAEVLRYWYRVAAYVAARATEPGTPLPRPESEAFRLALTDAATHALERADPERFGPTFRSGWDALARAAEIPPADVPTRVLVVDDFEDLRTLVSLALDADARFTVVAEAGDGLEAVEKCTASSPDIVLLDVTMPRMDGLAALPLLKEQCPEALVFMYSAEVDPDVRRRALEGGALMFLEKGMPLAQLLDQLAQASSP